ncbi:MAG: UDP-N-acetylmuramoyl-L-alanyl-D-glutamate--2,6-diaminopimelate ligase [Acidobacteria bacterium]|nr:MAG: UDP-N-acetylmuramoyl-L-alanyl-D-glutamate--2,6-diaminopimelate ligase [Acidobacteriota bacterium]
MKLRELLSGLNGRIIGDPDTEILGLAYDSRKVSPGFLFVAVRGTRMDGNRFLPQAIAKGAAGIVSSAPPIPSVPTPWIQVEDERTALAVLAANFYQHPTKKLHLVGVTGTNGKTTTTYLIESILTAAGRPTAVLGTIEYRGPGFDYAAERTTPEAPDLERLFKQVADAGWRHAVLEVSSHAIEMKRVMGLQFEIAVFTNLSRDHLDFHGDMESYFEAKKKLFTGGIGVKPRLMVLNMDDPRYEDLGSIDPSRVIRYGMQFAAEICPLHHHFGWDGTDATYKTPLGELEVHASLMGKPNLYNIGASIGVAIALGIPAEAIQSGIQRLRNVPGRFEPVIAGQLFRVIVDYAHTDDALEKVLRSARDMTSGRVIVVFGCGGERDRTKRPLMGAVAERESDYAIVTSDNPRGEDPIQIIREIEEGIKGSHYLVVADRREAIRAALAYARTGDTVVIAGKGHETYQTIGDTSYAFDDRVVARELLDELVTGRNP